MSTAEPVWALTDQALVLILHAEHDMASTAAAAPASPAPVRRFGLSASIEAAQWSRESAVLRMISTVEAYTDAAAEHWLSVKGLPPSPRQPFTWKDRAAQIRSVQNVDITIRAGWDEVNAGVDLRNCLAHGLGALTPIMLKDPTLSQRMSSIAVDVHGGRMHPRHSTTTLLADACRRYLADLERELVAAL